MADGTGVAATTDKGTSTAADGASEKASKPSPSNDSDQDIRRHPKYGFQYEVRRYNALYHVSQPSCFHVKHDV